MSLVAKLTALAIAIGNDIKSLLGRVTALEVTALSPWLVTATAFTHSSTAFVDVPGLSQTLAAGKMYRFEFDVVFSVSNNTRGVGFAVNGPASPVFCVASYCIPTNLVAATSAIFGNSRAYNVGPQSISVDLANAPLMATITGLIKVGATGGVFTLRTNGEATTATYKIHAGSVGRFTEVTA